jgi:hypothetical protein
MIVKGGARFEQTGIECRDGCPCLDIEDAFFFRNLRFANTWIQTGDLNVQISLERKRRGFTERQAHLTSLRYCWPGRIAQGTEPYGT